ncbi:hypothetical protein PVA38_11250 [Streptococcus pneumoniae D39]|nr:hypothetical protein PVA38_11250 [Streptococcus pneumoniae D39]
MHDKVDTVCTVIDVATCDFKELHPTEGYKKMAALISVSYTHLTLPTKLEV